MTDLLFRVAREFDVVTIRLSREVKEHLARCEEQTPEAPFGRCRYCGEPLYDPAIEKPQRGNHRSCAGTIYHYIDVGAEDEDGDLITNESFIKKGKWLPPKPGGREPKAPAAKYRRIQK